MPRPIAKPEPPVVSPIEEEVVVEPEIKQPITTVDEISELRKQLAEAKERAVQAESKNADFETQLKTQSNTAIAQHNVRIRNFSSTVDGTAFAVDKTQPHWHIQAHHLDTGAPWEGVMKLTVPKGTPIQVVFKNGLFVTNDAYIAGLMPFQSGVESITPHTAD